MCEVTPVKGQVEMGGEVGGGGGGSAHALEASEGEEAMAGGGGMESPGRGLGLGDSSGARSKPLNRVAVFARCRPGIAREVGEGEFVRCPKGRNRVSVTAPGRGVSSMSGKELGAKDRSFDFDGVFGAECGQEEVFAKVGQPVLDDVMRGYNGSILAYGQTGSGKTHTLLHDGEVSDTGMLPRLAAGLFYKIARDRYHVYTVTLSMCQIYNEQVDDLLKPANFNLKLRATEGGGRGWECEGLTWVECKGPESLLNNLRSGRNSLVYAETKMNKHSSRSHCVIQMRVEKRRRSGLGDADEGDAQVSPAEDLVTLKTTVGKLTVVDLAGSERVKKSEARGQRFEEAKNINSSLLAFGNVVQALASKQSHVPYRDAKLTRLIEDCVGGNCKTNLLVCVSPAEGSVGESISTLEFASRAMRIESNAKVNEGVAILSVSKLNADLAEAFSLEANKDSIETISRLEHELQAQKEAQEAAETLAKAAVDAAKSKLIASENAAVRARVEMERKLKEAQMAQDILNEKIGNDATELKGLKLRVKEVERDLEKSRATTKERVVELRDVRKQYETMVLTLAGREKACKSAEAERDEALKMLEEEKKAHAATQSAKSVLETEMSGAAGKLAERTQEAGRAVEALRAAEAEHAKLRESLVDVDSQLAQVREELQRVKEEDREALEAKERELLATRESLASDLEAREGELIAAREAMAESLKLWEAEKQALETTLGEAIAEREREKNRYEERFRLNDEEHAQRMEEMRAEMQAKARNLEELTEELQDKENRLGETAEQADRARKEADGKGGMISQLLSELVTLRCQAANDASANVRVVSSLRDQILEAREALRSAKEREVLDRKMRDFGRCVVVRKGVRGCEDPDWVSKTFKQLWQDRAVRAYVGDKGEVLVQWAKLGTFSEPVPVDMLTQRGENKVRLLDADRSRGGEGLDIMFESRVERDAWCEGVQSQIDIFLQRKW